MGIMQSKQNNHKQRKVTEQLPAAELSEQAIHNLVGFFDVLIQMDFAYKFKQRNEDRSKEDGKSSGKEIAGAS